MRSIPDSLSRAKSLSAAIDAMLADPSDATLTTALTADVAARVPYQQTEAYRFGNPIVDDWEPRANSWPLDEGLIDYVEPAFYGTESDENGPYAADVIANKTLVHSTALTPCSSKWPRGDPEISWQSGR